VTGGRSGVWMGTDMAATSSASAKAEILRRVRVAIGGVSDSEVARAGWSGLTRGYQRSATRGPEEVLALLKDRLRDYDAQVVSVRRADVAATVATMLGVRGKKRMVVPAGISAEWLPVGFGFVVDEEISAVELDGFDGVMTGSTVAIAQTGTVVLQNMPAQGRRAVTLVPDYHLCVVRVEDVVETVPEAMARLQETAGLATTFFSGPSATADIEMTRIKGVHGPRYLDIVLVG
jgi:L-lactate dehydrogenase complex protein LldG